ncbi:MAG: DUF4915 domain-containing protein [Deltaproteobacteria bacterium]|nr:DUF4915 domain-containing protein [Deltaproteobacteria bacterium]
MQAVWKSWQALNKQIGNRKVVLFGKSADWAEKTLRYSSFQVAYVVDNSPNLEGTTFHGLSVYSPKKLLDEPKDGIYIVITTGAYESVFPQLDEYGFKAGEHYCCSPVMNNLKVLSDIHGHQQKVMIASPDHPVYSEIDKDSDVGGGIYIYDIGEQSYEKVLSGSFHQIAIGKDVYYVVHHTKGVHIISKDFKVLDIFPLPEDAKPHGVAYCPKRDLIYVANSGSDSITIHDAKTLKHEETIYLSDKYRKTGLESHHINDLFVKDDILYVSFFSFSGNFQHEIFDGGIAEYDLNDLSTYKIIISDAWMPHSVSIIDGHLCYLDSMRGTFHRTDKKISGKFPGFTRGLSYDGQYYYIGQSENRYFDRLSGVSYNIALNAGFYLFDDITKASKFFVLPKLRQVHDLHVLG